MRIPNKINICGIEYDIKQEKGEGGVYGIGDTETQTITITADEHSAGRKAATVIHEIIELIMYERNLRYHSPDREVKFVMSHKEFDFMSMDIANVIEQLVGKNEVVTG